MEEKKKFKIDYLQTLSLINMTNSINGLIWTICDLISRNTTYQLLGYGFTIMGLCGIATNAIISHREKKKERATLQNPNDEATKAVSVTETPTNDNYFLNLYKPGTEEWTLDRLDRIGWKCKTVKPYTEKAIQDINEINRLGHSISQFEQIATKKTLITQLKEQHVKVKEAILQNARDIIGICTMSEAEAKGDLTNEEISRIQQETESSQTKLDMLKVLMKETGQSAIQSPEEEVFGNIDLESSIKAAKSFNQSSRKALY